MRGESIEFTITRTGGTGDAVVNVVTEAMTATSSIDYVAINESLFFSEGETSKTVSLVTATGDDEPTETVALKISSSDESATFDVSEMVVSIIDNDAGDVGTFALSVDEDTITEGDDVTLLITRSEGFTGAVTGVVEVTYSDGQASKSYDVAFADSQSTVELVLNTTDDSLDKPSFRLEAQLVVEGATVTDDSVSVLVMDNDTAKAPDSGSDSGSGGGSAFYLLGLAAMGLFRKRH